MSSLGIARSGAGDPPEVWGGIECTINRIGDRWAQQISPHGRGLPLEDLDRVAALGVRALRFPVLWEQFESEENGLIDWSWADARLGRLRDLGVRPIVGLVHHGSGPGFTSLVDPRFPERLARYARRVAERYPWVEAFTPVNEPLTTARFSGLYGHWYPHGRDPATFVRALYHEVRGTALAMAAIREVNRDARLVQTDDIGKIFSTPELQYQADYENERRWLGFDLLFGRVDREHAIWEYLRRGGMTEAEREELREHACPPDVVGLNHYVTSDRYLDGDLSRYPARTHGGNERHRYADVEAVRARREGVPRPAEWMCEAWERYGVPIAVTEVHLGCTREEQMRWLLEIWEDAVTVRAQGVDLRAITAWSLFGARDWDSLLTRADGHYEPGVFDLRSGRVRPTALATMLEHLAARGSFHHPVLMAPGWWHRSIRLAPEVASPAERESRATLRRTATPTRRGVGPFHHVPEASAPLLITGGEGALGQAFARMCYLRGIPYRLLTRAELDASSLAGLRNVLQAHRPWAIVHASRWSGDTARREEPVGWVPSLTALGHLAVECAARSIGLMTFSSDEVFGGSGPWLEESPLTPSTALGRMLAAGEKVVRESHPAALIVRVGPCFGPWDRLNFVATTRVALRAGRCVAVPADERVSPSYLPDVANTALDLFLDGESGGCHLANGAGITWADWAREIARRDEADPSLIVALRGPVASRELATGLGQIMLPLESAMDRCFADAATEAEVAQMHAEATA